MAVDVETNPVQGNPDQKSTYTKDSTALDQTQDSTSAGDGEETGISRPWYRRCGWLRHWKHGLYAVIWLLFTG